MEVHFAPPLADEFTGTPETTEVVVVRKLTSQRNTWEAFDARDGGVVVSRTTPTAFLPEDGLQGLLTEWGMRWNEVHGDREADRVPAWVFVHLNNVAGSRCFAAVRPTHGAAFAHVLQAGSRNHGQNWAWLTDSEGNRRRDVPEPTVSEDGADERYEWPDGSAIVVQAQMAWDFGFHRDELTDERLVETCAGEGYDPRFVWPATVN